MKEFNLFLLRLGEYYIKNIDCQEVTSTQIYSLWSFLNMLTPYKYKTLIARGESDENLRKHYYADTTQLPMLLEIMFTIGEKSRQCLGSNICMDPDDTSCRNFLEICYLLRNALISADKGSSGRIKRMNDFIFKNRKFVDAFLSKEQLLTEKYKKLPSEGRKQINMYYLALLHTINSSEYKYQSNYISTSQKLDAVERFERSLMIIGWMPKRSFQTYVSSRDTNDFVAVCKSVGLPFAETPVYPEQAEISVRYGLLPHFIIGAKVKDAFYVNPSLFETMKLFEKCDSITQMRQLRSDIIMHGLKVNQEKFLEYCQNTNYRRYFTYDGAQYRLNPLK